MEFPAVLMALLLLISFNLLVTSVGLKTGKPPSTLWLKAKVKPQLRENSFTLSFI